MRIAIKDIICSFKETGSVTAVARQLGISRPTVYRWLKRGKTLYGYLKWKGVTRQSTQPHTTTQILPLSMHQALVTLREKRHYGARKLQKILSIPTSARTVHRFLKAKHLISPGRSHRRPLFQNGHAMRPRNTTNLGYLQMDTKHVTPELSGLPMTVYEYAAIDIISRYKVAVILPDITDESASLALAFFRKWFPFPIQYVQTDNGLEFQRTFDDTCRTYGITHYYIHKNSPNENAVIERSFRTDQDEFYYLLQQAPEHMGELNEWLQVYMREYNTIRPHESLDYLTPEEFMRRFLSVT